MLKFMFRHGFWTGLACVCVCCCLGSFSIAAEPGSSDQGLTVAKNTSGIDWLPYETGLARSKAENKKVFLHFYTDRCHYCKVMANNTFVDKKVISSLNEKFISIKVDLAKNPSFSKLYPVRGVPTSWFLESTGEKIGLKPGYLPPDMFLKMLDFILSEEYKKGAATGQGDETH